MKRIHSVLVLLLLVALPIFAGAQSLPDSTKLIRGAVYSFTKTNGTQFTGSVLNQDEKDVMIDAETAGIVLIHKADIKKIRVVTLVEPSENKSSGPFIYGEIGGSGGTHRTFKTALNVILDPNTIISASFNYSTRNAPNSEYGSGELSAGPEQKLSMFSLLYGRVIWSRSPKFRCTLKGGVTGGTVVTPIYSNHNGSHYNSYERTDTRNTGGIVLNPTIELPAKKGSGVSFGLYGNINNVSPVFGLEGTMMFGKLRNKTKREILQMQEVRAHKSVKKNRNCKNDDCYDQDWRSVRVCGDIPDFR